ncbi:MAG: cryptochrome/photolyase family protein [Brachybacterium sp.]|nr:cryptochrome/photolyase family protein [Brachybacterium sp.]
MPSDHPDVRLVLPHQLFEEQLQIPQGTVVVLIEHDLYVRQYAFHAHKLVLHRASMDRFTRRLSGAGYTVEVLRSRRDRSSREQLVELLQNLSPSSVTWFDVVDDWLAQDLEQALADAGCAVSAEDVLESPNFLTTREQIDAWFGTNDARMQDFYRWQRTRLNVLLDEDGGPLGGQWSFDPENRKKLPRGYTPPVVGRFAHHPVVGAELALDLDGTADDDTGRAGEDVERAIAWVAEEFPDAPGDPQTFAWPTSAEEACEHLAEFVTERLDGFGPYEDAISATHPFIHHGLLTASLNIGLLSPAEVLTAALGAADEDTPLASLEGFVRQVIGWREYMRATYCTRGRRLRTSNHLGHHAQLGPGWWTGKTGLKPVDLVISRVRATGYCHHIERLMVLGNAMCLLRIHPDEVYRWFCEMFIDAYDWVMVPNVYAMSQYAAADSITTKPYVSGSNYLKTMSDLPPGEWQADWDALYWTFVEDHREIFAQNPRAHMIASHLDRMDGETLAAHRERAARWLE